MAKRVCWLALAFCLPLCLLSPIANGNGAAPAPLFDSDQVLNVRIAAAFDIDPRDWPVDEYVSGQFYYTAGNGELVELDVGIKVRGQYRRRPEVCSFPPLRLNFKKSQVKDTFFAGQDKLKLVTHCSTGSHFYEQAILAEFLAYRILNQLTDISFRVRLLRIEYTNISDGKSFHGYGILIEHKDNLAKRIGMPPLSVEKIPVSELDLDYLNLVSVFQYLIGNTDFASSAGGSGGECCHNHTLFGSEGDPYYSIPYDFDMSGFVDAPYAAPNPKLRLESVQERLYRGRCINNDLLPATLEHFRAKRYEIEAMVREQPELSQRRRSDMLNYIDKFYRSISSSRGIKRNLVRKCR